MELLLGLGLLSELTFSDRVLVDFDHLLFWEFLITLLLGKIVTKDGTIFFQDGLEKEKISRHKSARTFRFLFFFLYTFLQFFISPYLYIYIFSIYLNIFQSLFLILDHVEVGVLRLRELVLGAS